MEWPEKESPPAEGHGIQPPPTIECGFCGRAFEPDARECPVCATPAGAAPAEPAQALVTDEPAPLRAWGSPSTEPATQGAPFSWPDKDDPSGADSPDSILSHSKLRVALGLAACTAAVVGVAAYFV